MMHNIIFRFGKRQIAMRDDGIWFIRARPHHLRGWGKWTPATFSKRPDGAWFNPEDGKARLPNDKVRTDYSFD